MKSLQVVGVVGGALHIPLAVTVWSMLLRRTPRRPLALWVAGAVLMGLGTTLFAARGEVPAWLSYELAMALAFASVALRVMALRLDLDLPPRAGLALLLWGLALGAYVSALRTVGEALSVVLSLASMLLASAVFAQHAWRAGCSFPSRSGRIVAYTEWLFCAALAVRLAAVLAGWTPAQGITDTWDLGLLAITSLIAALYGNLGYLGMALDRSSAAAQRERDERLAETLRRELAETQATRLQELLLQRDTLAAERERLLQLLALQVRQPLHNASGALQSAVAVLAPGTVAPITPALERLARAQAVLGQVQGVLDNTLAAAHLLMRAKPLLKTDIELDFFVALVLGDLEPVQRSRVHVVWRTSFRSVEMEPGLMRLALRNLLLAALQQLPVAAPVWLTLEEQAAPSALCLRLSAHAGEPDPAAPGAAASAYAQAQAAGAAGLQLARQVVAAHGGQLQHGGTADAWALPCRLVLDQQLEEDSAAAAPD